MVSDNEQIATFHKVAEMPDGQINGKQLTVKRAVLLCGIEFP